MKNQRLLVLIALLLGGLQLNAQKQSLAGVWKIQMPQGILAMDVSKDSKKVVTGGLSNELTVCDLATGKKLMELKGHSDNIVAVRFSPNGRYIVSGGVDKTIILWDAITGDIIRQKIDHGDYVRDLVFSPDSKLFASASWDGTAIVWDTFSGQRINTIASHNDNVTAVDFNQDGTELLTGSGDHSICVWDTKTWAKKYEHKEHTDEVWDARFSPNGRYIVSGAWDNMCRVWDIAAKKQIYKINAHVSDVWSTTFTPDQQVVVTGGGDNFVRVWDIANGELIAESPEGMHTGSVESVAVSQDNKNIVSVDRNGNLVVWHLPTYEQRISAFTNKQFAEWSKKSTYEKQDDYASRIAKKDDFIEQWKKEYQDLAVSTFIKMSDWTTMKIIEYDAEKSIFKLNSPYFGKLSVKVSNRDAEKFEQSFKSASFTEPQITLSEFGFMLQKAGISFEANAKKIYTITPLIEDEIGESVGKK